MVVSADAKGRSVKTFYIGQRLVRIRIEPKGKKVEAEAPVPAAPVFAEEIQPRPEEARAKPTEVAPAAPAPAAPAPAPAAGAKTATVECPACNKSFDVPVDAMEGICPNCGAELLFEDVVDEPKKDKGSGFMFWKKKRTS